MECGIDVVKISRFEKNLENDLFLEKYFSKQEIEYINSKNSKTETIAGLFACKEAFLKALGIGIGGGIDLKEIDIYHENGKPKIQVTPKIDYYLTNLSCSQVSVSISHDGDIATAICVIA